MKILLIGNGMLGKEIQDHFKNDLFCVFDIPNGDITKEYLVDQYVNLSNPDIVINTAAITNVDACEDSLKEEAYLVNVMGASNVARSCLKYNRRLIHISTDFVFGGYSTIGQYTELDVPHFNSIYGETKRLGEIAVLENCKNAVIVRTAWLYGIHGNNFVHTMLKLMAKKDKISVVSDQFGCPTSTKELCRILEKIIECYWLTLSSNRIIHGVCCGSTTWYEFAKTILNYFASVDCSISCENGIAPTKVGDCAIDKISYTLFLRKAKTPLNSTLISDWLSEYLPARQCWKDALNEYIITNCKTLKEML